MYGFGNLNGVRDLQLQVSFVARNGISNVVALSVASFLNIQVSGGHTPVPRLNSGLNPGKILTFRRLGCQ